MKLRNWVKVTLAIILMASMLVACADYPIDDRFSLHFGIQLTALMVALLNSWMLMKYGR